MGTATPSEGEIWVFLVINVPSAGQPVEGCLATKRNASMSLVVKPLLPNLVPSAFISSASVEATSSTEPFVLIPVTSHGAPKCAPVRLVSWLLFTTHPTTSWSVPTLWSRTALSRLTRHPSVNGTRNTTALD